MVPRLGTGIALRDPPLRTARCRVAASSMVGWLPRPGRTEVWDG